MKRMQKNPSLLTRFPYHIVFILFISLQSLHPQSHKLINWQHSPYETASLITSTWLSCPYPKDL